MRLRDSVYKRYTYYTIIGGHQLSGQPRRSAIWLFKRPGFVAGATGANRHEFNFGKAPRRMAAAKVPNGDPGGDLAAASSIPEVTQVLDSPA